MDSVPKETHVAVVSDEKDDRLLPAPISKAETDEGRENPQKHQATKRKAVQTQGAKFRAGTKFVKNPSCKCWHPPVCQDCKSETGCKYGGTCFFRHVEAEEKPSKKSKKGGAKKISCIIDGVYTIGCVSQDSCPRKSISST